MVGYLISVDEVFKSLYSGTLLSEPLNSGNECEIISIDAKVKHFTHKDVVRQARKEAAKNKCVWRFCQLPECKGGWYLMHKENLAIRYEVSPPYRLPKIRIQHPD